VWTVEEALGNGGSRSLVGHGEGRNWVVELLSTHTLGDASTPWEHPRSCLE
jgi:hypothetical protein